MANAHINILGNLVKDPELKLVGDQNVCSMTVAVNTSAKDDAGAYISNFYNVSLWGKKGEYIARNAQKSTLVWVCGDMTQVDVTDANGGTHKALRINATSVDIAARRKPVEGAIPDSVSEKLSHDTDAE